ncbi:MAG: rhodanese-like domain-containing protein [Proteobacteria bacterium]|nr:rhodanese-like domain-containing protein [Pseudomonadota bacterium]NOG60716.1 rhodanese-like domain-containing protein [Pseudomonadota bacterium]
MIKEVVPEEAYEILKNEKNAVLVDVRSTMEYDYVGHPLNAIHVALKEPPDWETRQNYTENVRLALQKQFPEMDGFMDVPLLMLCRSGARSAIAGEMLINEGFTNVYNVLEGFEGDKDEHGHRSTISGWRFHGLPWEQS